MTIEQTIRIRQCLQVFETGNVQGNYSLIVIFYDGWGSRRQVTYGIGFTEDSGSLSKVIENYLIREGGRYKTALRECLPFVGKGEMYNNIRFKYALMEAGKEPSMQAAQEYVYDEWYMKRARLKAKELQLQYPLSILVVEDGYLHGSFSEVRSLFPESPPCYGGDEKDWVIAYVHARRAWLSKHPRLILRRTVYRMDCFLQAIAENNWDLKKPLNANDTMV